MRFSDGDEMLGLANLNNENNDDILWRDEKIYLASLSGHPDTIPVIRDRSSEELLSYDPYNF